MFPSLIFFCMENRFPDIESGGDRFPGVGNGGGVSQRFQHGKPLKDKIMGGVVDRGDGGGKTFGIQTCRCKGDQTQIPGDDNPV